MFPASFACPDCGAHSSAPHAHWCSSCRRHEPPHGPLLQWLASLPAEYERLKAHEAACTASLQWADQAE